MQTLSRIKDLRDAMTVWRRAGDAIAFVPTMGNLHQGHLALVEEAKAKAKRVVVSIFVNPLQFGPNEDFAAYPRTLEQDLQSLRDAAADLVFTPTNDELYPQGQTDQTNVIVPATLTDILCGASRPGHFTGVATVVLKLLQIVQPDVALLGKKDFQQVAVLRKMALDLNLPVEIATAATVREANGLAMSSRNQYLTDKEREVAPALYQSLQHAAKALQQRVAITEVERRGVEELTRLGFQIDYLEVRRATDLQSPQDHGEDLVILVAAKLGKTRLIDNLEVSLPPQ